MEGGGKVDYRVGNTININTAGLTLLYKPG
jgi:hypothetical protein